MNQQAIHTEVLDIEEELTKFTVRSNKVKKTEKPVTRSRDYKNEISMMPLLVKDVHQLKLPDQTFSETITAYGFPFGTVLLYGRLTSTGASANGKLRYTLDDGSGIIKVRLLARKGLKEVTKLEHQCFRLFGSNKDLYNSVQNILKETRKQLLDVGVLPYGTRAVLIGRPHMLFEEVVFTVFELILDTDQTNELEMAVKNYIVEWYVKRYKPTELKDLLADT